MEIHSQEQNVNGAPQNFRKNICNTFVNNTRELFASLNGLSIYDPLTINPKIVCEE